MTYRPTPQYQLQNHDPLGSVSCGFYAGAMWLDRDTEGKVIVTGRELRKHQSDQSGGASQDSVAAAIASTYIASLATTAHVSPLPKLAKWKGHAIIGFDEAWELCRWGRALLVAMLYAAVRSHVSLRGSESFRGTHAQEWNEVRGPTGPGGEVLVYDPLCDGRRAGIAKGPVWYPYELAREVAAGMEYSAGKVGAGRIFVRVSRITGIASPKPEVMVQVKTWVGWTGPMVELVPQTSIENAAGIEITKAVTTVMPYLGDTPGGRVVAGVLTQGKSIAAYAKRGDGVTSGVVKITPPPGVDPKALERAAATGFNEGLDSAESVVSGIPHREVPV